MQDCSNRMPFLDLVFRALAGVAHPRAFIRFS
jgi:hypothetical protein